MKAALTKLAIPFGDIHPPAKVALGILIWCAIIGLWSALSYGGAVSAMFLPTPTRVMTTAAGMIADGSLFKHVWASSVVVIGGFVISSILAVPFGLWTGTYKAVAGLLEPAVNFIRYLPVTSFVPLFILWIGIGIEQRLTVIFFGTFFQQLVMIADSARAVPRDLVNASYTLGTQPRRVVWHVIFPAALPSIIDTLRVTMGWAWTYLVVAELVAASSGLGYISLKAMRGFQVDIIFLAIAAIGILGLITDQCFRALRVRLTPWAR